MHELNIVHRDIKPDNIMMSNGQCIVADFGVSRILKANEEFVSDLVFEFHTTQAGSGFY